MTYMKHIRILMVALAAALFCSCQKDDVDNGQQSRTDNEPIKFNISIDNSSLSRLNNDDLKLMKTQFEEGDEIGIWVMKRPIYQSDPELPMEGNNVRLINYVLILKDGEWGFFLPQDSTKNIQLLRQPGFRFDYYAYYPARTGVWSSVNPMNLTYSARTSDSRNIMNNDFLAAVNTDCPDGTTEVNLNFKHLLSMFEIRQPGLGDNASVKLVSPNIVATGNADFSKTPDDPDFFYTNNKFDDKAVVGQAIEFQAYANGRYRVWLPPQSIPVGDDTYIEICADKSTKTDANTIAYTLKPDDDGQINFKRGQSRYLEVIPKFNEQLLYTPNSIVHTSKLGQTKNVPIAKAYAMWLNDPVLSKTHPYLYGELKIKQLWSDRPDFEQYYDVKLSNANKGAAATLQIGLKAQAGGAAVSYEGNAVYGLYIGDTLRWSWHMWDSSIVNPTENTYMYDGRTFMNANLGAWPSQADTTTGAVRGLLYQYGRKDPFPGATAKDWEFTQPQAMYDTSGLINAELPYGIFVHNSTRVSNVDSTTVNPMAFAPNWNPQGTLDLWNVAEGGKKSPYDPCPVGWRVGVAPQSVWYKGGSSNIADYTDNEWDNGLSFISEGYRLGYYPQTNHRLATGAISTESSISLWHGGTQGNSFTIDGQTLTVNTNDTKPQAIGQAVRCVKDDNDKDVWNVYSNPDFWIWKSFDDKLVGKYKY